jgi:protein ImuB
VLARLLEPLCADLQREERGAAVVGTRLDLVTRTAYDRRLQLPAPMNDPKVLRTLILLDLEAHPPDAGIDRVSIRLEPAPGRRVQFALFRRPLPAPDRVATLMARLGALMGEGRCGSPRLLDTHRPGSFAMDPFAPRDPGRRGQAGMNRSDGDTAGPAGQPAPARRRRPGPEQSQQGHGQGRRPDIGEPASSHARDGGQPQAVLRRFRHPLPVRVTLADGRPARLGSIGAGLTGGVVDRCAGPWRTSGAWWTDRSWDRDEWDVALHGGLVCRVSRGHADGHWQLEGVWD